MDGSCRFEAENVSSVTRGTCWRLAFSHEAESPCYLLTGLCACCLQLDSEAVVRDYKVTSRRLVLLGYNATLTTAVEAPRQPKRHFDQIQVGPLCCRSN